MSDLTDTLNPEQTLLWQEYLSAETQRVRPRTLSALSEFIEALQADSQERRDAFAEAFCRLTADDGAYRCERRFSPVSSGHILLQLIKMETALQDAGLLITFAFLPYRLLEICLLALTLIQ